MSAQARYLIAQFTPDVIRKVPMNVGVVVQREGEVTARFWGERDGRVDGRTIQKLNAPGVYRQWVEYWRSQLGHLEDIEELASIGFDQYRLIRGGKLVGTGEDPILEVTEYLYNRLVGGGFAAAVAEGEDTLGDAQVLEREDLTSEIEDELLTRHIFEAEAPEVFVQVPYPVRKGRSLSGRSRVEHRPHFVQENGTLCVMEAVDLTSTRRKPLKDHAGLVAFMYEDIREAQPAPTEAISIVRVTDENRQHEEIQESLWILESRSRVIDWLAPGDREEFLRSRERMARGEVESEGDL